MKTVKKVPLWRGIAIISTSCAANASFFLNTSPVKHSSGSSLLSQINISAWDSHKFYCSSHQFPPVWEEKIWQKHCWSISVCFSPGIWMSPFHNTTCSHLCFIRLDSHSVPPTISSHSSIFMYPKKAPHARLGPESPSAVSSKPHTAPTWNKPDPAAESQRFQNVKRPRTQFKLFRTDSQQTLPVLLILSLRAGYL